ncbi:uncharacterized protein [Magallana gigas]|uniref:uncharacterized protein n=1 Tax=Magallana gigas TaxID=29159 RepID=UPI003342DFB1
MVKWQEHPLDTADPGSIFGETSEDGSKASPHRTGNLRQRGAFPTHHFAANEIKSAEPVPMRLFPYEEGQFREKVKNKVATKSASSKVVKLLLAIMTSSGIVYDAYTMDRWTDPERTDLMMQQSAWKSGEPWNKLTDMGTNMRQVVPLVRGSALLTHLFTNANPVVKPFCLADISGHHVNFNSPLERTILDAGSGHASATCSGGVLHLRLQNTKRIRDVTKIQYAARLKTRWAARDHPMSSCDVNKCQLTDGGKTLEVDVPNAHGAMAFAFNYIGHYVTPWDWINHPEEVTCHGRRSEKRAPNDITLHASCDSNLKLEIGVYVGHHHIYGVDKIQYAVEPENTWGNPPPMHTCNPTVCSRVGNTIYVRMHAPAQHLKINSL